MKIDFGYAWNQLVSNWPLFWYGIKMTVAFALVGTLAGLVLGLVIGAIRTLPIDPQAENRTDVQNRRSPYGRAFFSPPVSRSAAAGARS